MLIGRVLKKIHVERKEITEEPARIVKRDGRMEIKDVRRVGDKIVVTCSYGMKYLLENGEEYANIEIEGEIITDEETLLKEWEKDKALTAVNTERLLNFFLEDANVYALLLTWSVKIPAPFNIPRVRIKGTVPEKTE